MNLFLGETVLFFAGFFRSAILVVLIFEVVTYFMLSLALFYVFTFARIRFYVRGHTFLRTCSLLGVLLCLTLIKVMGFSQPFLSCNFCYSLAHAHTFFRSRVYLLTHTFCVHAVLGLFCVFLVLGLQGFHRNLFFLLYLLFFSELLVWLLAVRRRLLTAAGAPPYGGPDLYPPGFRGMRP